MRAIFAPAQVARLAQGGAPTGGKKERGHAPFPTASIDLELIS